MSGVTENEVQQRDTTPFQILPDAEDEIIFAAPRGFDYFYQSQATASFLHNDFYKFLQDYQPDVIHFHHTMRIGLEALAIARRAVPQARIIYTLHEYIFICHHNGQMVRTRDNALCSKASPAACHGCFPEISPQQFLMREQFIKAHLQYIDQFVSPSRFLADRFVEWGIDKDKITVLENGRHVSKAAKFRPLAKGEKRNVFGYFGQINPYKGAMLALEAVELLRKEGFSDFRLEFFGNVGLQSDEFRQRFEDFLEQNKEQVTFHGKYKSSDIPRLMEQVDWVLVPSTWWENSPLVIQETFMHKRPIICSDIGGMAEKVEDGKTGLHFEARNSASLAATIRKACASPALWKKLSANIGPRLSMEDSAAQHMEIYNIL